MWCVQSQKKGGIYSYQENINKKLKRVGMCKQQTLVSFTI